MHSDIALKVLAAKECGVIRSNAQFWADFSDLNKFDQATKNSEIIKKTSEEFSGLLDSSDIGEGIVCAFDAEFPVISPKVKNKSEKPYLIFYKGDLSLLNDLNKNVSVIGLINPDTAIVKRERVVVEKLVKANFNIVSGLAAGCDSVAHKTCLEYKGKTIAILPSPINKIYPAENSELAQNIMSNNGLLISEYYKEPLSRNEAISRLIERDRLQAMFAKAIIMIASYRKGEGDSGSRHAMESARKYMIDRFVLYNEKTDENNEMFALNKDLATNTAPNKAHILKSDFISTIESIKNPDLIKKPLLSTREQISFL